MTPEEIADILGVAVEDVQGYDDLLPAPGGGYMIHNASTGQWQEVEVAPSEGPEATGPTAQPEPVTAAAISADEALRVTSTDEPREPGIGREPVFGPIGVSEVPQPPGWVGPWMPTEWNNSVVWEDDEGVERKGRWIIDFEEVRKAVTEAREAGYEIDEQSNQWVKTQEVTEAPDLNRIFPTWREAAQELANRGLTETHNVVPSGGGFQIQPVPEPEAPEQPKPEPLPEPEFVIGSDGNTYRRDVVGGPWEIVEAPPVTPDRVASSIDQLIAEALDAGNWDKATAFWDFKNQPPQVDLFQAAMQFASSDLDFDTLKTVYEFLGGGAQRIFAGQEAPIANPFRQPEPMAARTTSVDIPGKGSFDIPLDNPGLRFLATKTPEERRRIIGSVGEQIFDPTFTERFDIPDVTEFAMQEEGRFPVPAVDASRAGEVVSRSGSVINARDPEGRLRQVIETDEEGTPTRFGANIRAFSPEERFAVAESRQQRQQQAQGGRFDIEDLRNLRRPRKPTRTTRTRTRFPIG